MINHYHILGLPNYASLTEVRKAYITQIKQYHPDVNSSHEAIEICKQLNVAKEALETEERKAVYDTRLKCHLERQKHPISTYKTPKNTQTNSKNTDAKIREEQRQRILDRKRAIAMVKYGNGLTKFPVTLRYGLSLVLGITLITICMALVIAEKENWLSSYFSIAPFFILPTILFVSEYYKYHDYLNYKGKSNFDYEKASKYWFYLLFFGALIMVLLAKLIASSP